MSSPIWAENAIRCLGVAPGERFTALVDMAERMDTAYLRTGDAK